MDKFIIKANDIDDNNDNDDDNDNDSVLSSLTSFSDNDDSYDDNISTNESIKDAVDPLTFFTSKELCYYKTIHKFFKNCNNKEINRMLEIINGTSVISLRVLDWFVTRYSKRKIEFFNNNDVSQQNNTLDTFDVHISYKSELKSYKKRYFDPFRRRKKFYYPLFINNNHDEPVLLNTTLGQLNFFVWAISNKIIDYVEKNLEQISKAMNLNNKDEKKKKQRKNSIKVKINDTKNSVNNNTIEIKKSYKVKNNDKKNLNNNNNVFNDYYNDCDNDNQLILSFD